MPNRLAKLRHRAYVKQSGLCHYCGLPMWENKAESDAALKGIEPEQATLRKCTAEHLMARCAGGKDAAQNIVAACHYCNAARHQCKQPMEPPQYLQYVQEQVKKGRWHLAPRAKPRPLQATFAAQRG